MAKERSRVLDFGVYLVIRMVVCIVQALSWSAAISFARFVARLARTLNRRHGKVAEENVRLSFPQMSESEIRTIVDRTYEHLALLAVEAIRLPRVLHATNTDTYIRHADMDKYHQVVNLVRTKQPLLVVTGHFGNWEIFSYVIGLLGFRGSVVARRLDNPYLDAFVKSFRRKTGQEFLDKNRDFERIEQVLVRREMLGMLGDQDAGPRGLFVDFLGRPASTFKSIALLSLQHSAPIMVMGAARIGHPMKYELFLEDLIFPGDYAHDPNATRAITQRFTKAIETMVLRHPEQYFWLHRRWKHAPPVRKSKAAA